MDAEDELTVWCGNLPSEIDEEILYELFLQVAPLRRVRIPNDIKSGKQANFGFVTFKHVISVQYAIDVMHGTKVFDKNIIVRMRNTTQQAPTPLVGPEQLAKMGALLIANTESGGRGGQNNFHNGWRNNQNNYNDKRENRNYRYDRNSNNYRNNRSSRHDNESPYAHYGRRRH